MQALEPSDPRAIGRYRLLARLGVGGTAIVYFGRSAGRRAAAVKVMHAELASYRERFRREVAATRAVGALLDADPDAAIPWLATEFLPAVSLRDAVRDHGPLPLDAAWPLAAGIAEALASIHRAGIAHLDVTPANVLLTLDGPRLIDFGVAAAVGSVRAGGSFGYTPPERVAGPAGDVYSFGVTMTFACTGARDAAGLEGIADPRLREVIAACLRSDAGGRPSVAELLAEATRSRHPGGGAAPLSPGGNAAALPAAVRADIDRRAGEARNPPVALSPPGSGLARPSRFTRRRTLLLVGGGLVAVSGGTLALRADRARVGVGAPIATSSAPLVTATSVSRTVEVYAYGSASVKTLSTVVDGRAETLENVPLPYQRIVQVPLTPVTWRFAYQCTGGRFNWVVTVDGFMVAGGGGSGGSDGLADDQRGTS